MVTRLRIVLSMSLIKMLSSPHTKSVPVLCKYAQSLESHVKQRYIEKISVIDIDPATLPSEQFDPHCLPPVEQSDLFSYLVLQTSYYTNEQFKNYKSLEAYNHVVSGFVAGVQGKLISGKNVVVAKVRHSQRMNDPLVDIWLICGTDGAVISAHCLGCKAGLAESCSHVASVLFYIECWTRLHGKLACTQVKCTWILPTYVKEVPYARVEDIDFTSAKKLKEKLDKKIDSFTSHETVNTTQEKSAHESNLTSQDKVTAPQNNTPTAQDKVTVPQNNTPTAQEIKELYSKLNKCKVKVVALSLIQPYADEFVMSSRDIPVVSELFDPDNLDLQYHELLPKCLEVNIDLSESQINTIEKDTRTQAKGPGFFRHRAGRIGASVSGAVYHSNLAQPPQSILKSICYPHLYTVNTKATRHGCDQEEAAIKAYETYMNGKHVNFQIKKCGVFISKEHPYLHATPDFLVSCDCCGIGCGEVKCPISVPDCDFDQYVKNKSAFLEKVDGVFKLKKTHNYYHQVQQQLFVLSERKYCDFVVCVWDKNRNAHILFLCPFFYVYFPSKVQCGGPVHIIPIPHGGSPARHKMPTTYTFGLKDVFCRRVSAADRRYPQPPAFFR
uniref:YqaJ viral recombinase domain-containing protein n=1 Tax=Branchiostoma floridae TaxID=7739 RepID=C3Z2X6_BRAFL|eukprot:XP_002597365.1 hypothetical protein BRAFLDRAFT_66500 [Branchiostoma floridae]